MKRIIRKEAVTRPSKAPISDKILQKAAARLFPVANQLVSTEITYLQRILNATSSQKEIDERVAEVRKLPWASIAGE